MNLKKIAYKQMLQLQLDSFVDFTKEDKIVRRNKLLEIAQLFSNTKLNEELKYFDWEGYNRGQKAKELFDILKRSVPSNKIELVSKFVNDNIKQILEEARKDFKKNVRQITEPWLVSMDQ